MREERDTHLLPQGFCQPVDEAAHLSELPRVFNIDPDTERRQRQPHQQVTQHRRRAQTHEARQRRRHVHHQHHGEQRGRRARREEDVLSLVVFEEAGVGFVHLLLQLLLIALAEVLAAHLLHAAELTHTALLQLLVTALQIRRRHVGPVSTAHLQTENTRQYVRVRACRTSMFVCERVARVCLCASVSHEYVRVRACRTSMFVCERVARVCSCASVSHEYVRVRA